MSLTERRRQFLKILKTLYEKNKRPIHYAEIAKELSVSPATAYDIMQILYKEGYVDAVYLENSVKNKKGRGKIFFKPKEYEESEKLITNFQELKRYPFAIAIILSIMLTILKDIKFSKDLRSIIGLLIGLLQSNLEIILVLLPILIIGYAGKKIYEIIPNNKIKTYFEEYINSINQLATEEKRVLLNFILNILEI
ncbi:winged helix-turn-helix transcriptional regulator [Dictyoglomus thermophilum]|uniref:winged helix-turn-helix transcriptional regulator n=1 Tax=Dictyoglomus thermophilum TaxID=14 RepID=UPI0011EB8F4A|nr:HTH domain-containing protein [Dictyoglomus thermophilum]TYT24381.1 winged helix-turn-helix transcriptional regulator [Dictyoglomus thermophilum]